MDKSNEMLTFVRVVDTGSFAAAARTLYRTPSAVSRVVIALEERLGFRLLERTTRSLKLTDVGREFYYRCTNILAEIERAEREIASLSQEPRGVLRISGVVAFAQHRVMGLLRAFRARYPQIELDLVQAERLPGSHDRDIDVALRIGRVLDEHLVSVVLCESRRVICGSPAYLAERGVPRDLEDLAQHDCIGFSTQPELNEWQFDTPQGPRIVQIVSPFRANTAELIRQAALAGAGLCRLSDFVLGPDIAAGRLTPVLLDSALPGSSSVCAVYARQKRTSRKLAVFVEYLQAAFEHGAPWQQPTP